MSDTTDFTVAARHTLNVALRVPHDRLEASLEFEGRDHYVAFVAVWKAQYREVVAEIRAAKAVRRDKGNAVQVRNDAQARRQYLRGDAHGLLAVRIAGKAVARKAREARLAQAA